MSQLRSRIRPLAQLYEYRIRIRNTGYGNCRQHVIYYLLKIVFSFQDYFERSVPLRHFRGDPKLLLLVGTLRIGSSFTVRPGGRYRCCRRRSFPGRWPQAACRSLRSSTPGAARRRACCRGCHSPPPCRSASPRSSQHLHFRWQVFSLVSKIQNIITWNTGILLFLSELRIRDVYPRSKFFHPGSRAKKISTPGPVSTS